MKERWMEAAPDADEKQEERFRHWLSGKGIAFINAEAEKAYNERATLIKDAIQLKTIPKRIPVCPSPGFFPVENTPGINMHDAMYNYEILANAWEKYCREYQTDAFTGPGMVLPGKILDILDFKLYCWPGHGVSVNGEYQCVEGEYMKAEEYQHLIDDPTGFFMNVYFPRIFGNLKPLEMMPLLPPVNEIPLVLQLAMPFAGEGMQSAFKCLADAGKEAMKWFPVVGSLNRKIMGTGFPMFNGGFAKAPFDVIGDTLRGTKGIMTDLYRHPDEVLEACERITPFMVKAGINSCKASGHPIPVLPLHKGADGFMSDQQYRKFYWPTLKKVIIGLVNEGLTPMLFAEGNYNSRLEIISDIPKGKVVWWFDNTDMAKAKETVGRVACIAGNVPSSVLCTGTPDIVKSYCKKLIDTAGRGGGFIFSTGAGMQKAKPENVKTMIDFSMEYGVYR